MSKVKILQSYSLILGALNKYYLPVDLDNKNSKKYEFELQVSIHVSIYYSARGLQVVAYDKCNKKGIIVYGD